MGGGAVWIAESKNFAIVWRYTHPTDDRYFKEYLDVVKKVPYKDTNTNTLELLGYIPSGSGCDILTPEVEAAFKEIEEEASQRKKYEAFTKSELTALDMWEKFQEMVKKNRELKAKVDRYEALLYRWREATKAMDGWKELEEG